MNYEKMRIKKVFIVVGARPNFMKVAPILTELKKRSQFLPTLIHTGQHYDTKMSNIFFRDLKLPSPDIWLGVGSGTHCEQTGRIIIEFGKVCMKQKPDLIIVVGDVNSTLACALVGAKESIPVAHIEAGLRSFDRSMPEEINRILTDQIAEYLFTTCEDANINLQNEGIPASKIFFVGNVMIDTLIRNVDVAKESNILNRLLLVEHQNPKKYAVVTVHRPSNVDDPHILDGILSALNELSKKIPIIFPAHPRTFQRIKSYNLEDRIFKFDDQLFNEYIDTDEKLVMISPLGYLDFLCLMSNATLVLTDSGGIQEETTILGVPCLTLRNNTERPVTVKEGTNVVVGNDPKKIVENVLLFLKNGKIRKSIPKYWDGKASERVANILQDKI